MNALILPISFGVMVVYSEQRTECFWLSYLSRRIQSEHLINIFIDDDRFVRKIVPGWDGLAFQLGVSGLYFVVDRGGIVNAFIRRGDLGQPISGCEATNFNV